MITTSEVCLTPLLGGREDGGVCSLLEIGGARVLLDCGCTINTPNEVLLDVARKLEAGGGVDCVLLSHADIHHCGALPVIFGSQGLPPVPVICTLPVAKFSMLMLYDLHLNIAMEGTPNNENAEDNKDDARRPTFTLEDVDDCLTERISLKYSQVCTLPTSGNSRRRTANSEDALQQTENSSKVVTFCAFNSGRTIGGAVWRICQGATEVLYAIDVNLKKEVVLNGAALETLPQGPELMIVEGGCAARTTATRKKGAKAASVGTTSAASTADDSDFMTCVNDTLRGRGNVLIPCESASRTLEVLQVLNRQWVEGRRGLDHLIFLSPMSFNLVELARSQLEWMTDGLSARFYNGQPNPFEMPPVKVVTTLRELERKYPGPKVVLATDASLHCGIAKELLLRWGGNPLNRVLFLDLPDAGTVGAALVDKIGSLAVVVRIAQPQRVELEGEELAAFTRDADIKRRAKEEEMQKRLREEALAVLNAGAGGAEREDDRTDNEGETDPNGSDMDVDETSRAVQKKARTETHGSAISVSQAARIAKFAQPLFPLFNTLERVWAEDEYGAAVDDMNLRVDEDVAAPTTGAPALPRAPVVAPTASAKDDQDPETLLPFKIMSSRIKVQFTCAFKVTSMSGRADIRAVKALTARVQPSRVVVLRGRSQDCDAVAQQLGTLSTTAPKASLVGTANTGATTCTSFAPANFETVRFTVRTDRVNLLIPSALLPASMKELHRSNASLEVSGSGSCTLSSVSGIAQEQAIASSNAASASGFGWRKVRLITSNTESNTENTAVVVAEEEDVPTADEFGFATAVGGINAAKCIEPIPQRHNVTVSVGEVSFNALKAALLQAGIATESVTATSADGQVGTMLVCEQQVMIKRAAENDFVVEGPPVAVYWAVRKVLYAHFAFLQS